MKRKVYKAHYTKYRQARRDYLRKLKSKRCTDCRRCYHFAAMEYDHVRGRKVKEISQMLSWSFKAIDKELAKCELVCSNCHRVRTWRRITGRD